MRNRDVGGALVQTFERKGIANKSGPRFLCLVGVGGELTGIESKPLSAALALIPLLSPGVSALDEVGVGVTAARAAFGCGIFQLGIQIQIFQSNLCEPLHLLLTQSVDRVQQFVFAHCCHLSFTLMASLNEKVKIR